MQNILDQRGIPTSARQFAQQHGIDTTRMLGSSNKESITEQVKGLLGQARRPPKSPAPDNAEPSASVALAKTDAGSATAAATTQPQQSLDHGEAGPLARQARCTTCNWSHTSQTRR